MRTATQSPADVSGSTVQLSRGSRGRVGWFGRLPFSVGDCVLIIFSSGRGRESN